MQCPHCNQETDPTLIYCKMCGEQMDLDPAAIHEAMRRDDELDAIEILEGRSRAAIYVAAFLLATVFALRFVLLRPVDASASVGYYAPASIVDEKALEPVSALDLEPTTIDVPDEKTVIDYQKRLNAK